MHLDSLVGQGHGCADRFLDSYFRLTLLLAHIHEESEPERDVLSYFVQPYIIAGWKVSLYTNV
jgi:hypothetical protein